MRKYTLVANSLNRKCVQGPGKQRERCWTPGNLMSKGEQTSNSERTVKGKSWIFLLVGERRRRFCRLGLCRIHHHLGTPAWSGLADTLAASLPEPSCMSMMLQLPGSTSQGLEALRPASYRGCPAWVALPLFLKQRLGFSFPVTLSQHLAIPISQSMQTACHLSAHFLTPSLDGFLSTQQRGTEQALQKRALNACGKGCSSLPSAYGIIAGCPLHTVYQGHTLGVSH